MDDGDAAVESAEERMLFLHEQMANFISQYSMPRIEVALVISRAVNSLVTSLTEVAEIEGEVLPESIVERWPIEMSIESADVGVSMERLLGAVDEDRIDILETIIRVSIETKRISTFDSILVLREWERLVRGALASSTSPGQLFSPLELPDGF